MEPVLWAVPDGGGGEGGYSPSAGDIACDSPLWACRWQAQALRREIDRCSLIIKSKSNYIIIVANGSFNFCQMG